MSLISFHVLTGAIFMSCLFVLPLFALTDLLKSRFQGNDKLVWAMVIIFVVLMGPILYFLIGRKQKLKRM